MINENGKAKELVPEYILTRALVADTYIILAVIDAAEGDKLGVAIITAFTGI